MKHSKWLLTLVLVLLIINVIFYIVWYAFDVQGLVKQKLESYLSASLKGKFQIQKLSINERHITANSVSFSDSDNKIILKVNQIQIRYNLLRLIFTGFSLNRVISQINVYEPDLVIQYDLKPTDKKKKPFEIPDLRQYFSTLSVRQGKVHLKFGAALGKGERNKLFFEEKLNNIGLEVRNDNHSWVKINAITWNKGTLEGTASLDKGLISEIKAQLQQYEPLKVSLSGFEDLNTEISVIAQYNRPDRLSKARFSYNAILWNSTAKYDKYSFRAPYLQVQGDESKLNYTLSESAINDHRLSAKGVVFNYLATPSTDSRINLTRVVLGDLFPQLKGLASAEVSLQGTIDDPEAFSLIEIPQLEAVGQTLDNVSLEVSYKDKVLSFAAQEFDWMNQNLLLGGEIDLARQKLVVTANSKPSYDNESVNLATDLTAELDFSRGISANAEIRALDFVNEQVDLTGFSGRAAMQINPQTKASELDLKLRNEEGVSLQVTGNPLAQDFKIELSLETIKLSDYLRLNTGLDLDSSVSGTVKASVRHNEVTGTAELALDWPSLRQLRGDVATSFALDWENMNGRLELETNNATLQGIPLTLDLKSGYKQSQIKIEWLKLDQAITAEGTLRLNNLYQSSLRLKADTLNLAKYWKIIKPESKTQPVSAIVSLDLDLSHTDANLVRGFIRADSLCLPEIRPLYISSRIFGSAHSVNAEIKGRTAVSDTLQIDGQVSLAEGGISLQAQSKLERIDLHTILSGDLIRGVIDGVASLKMNIKPGQEPDPALSVDVTGHNLRIQNIVLEDARLKATQQKNIIVVDTVRVDTEKLISLRGGGILDYNIFTNRFYNGDHLFRSDLNGDVLRLLTEYVPFLERASGDLDCSLLLKTGDEGIGVESGSIKMRRGFIKIKGQPERVNEINIDGSFANNELKLDRLSAQIKPGKLYARNAIDPAGDNFHIGPLNLGYLLVRTSDNGIQLSIPDYLPSNTVATAVLKGQNSREATIMGPLDNMEIRGEIIASNGSAVYPADTKNLLQLINVFQKKPRSPEIPLPFTLDLVIRIAENVRYVTYPADLVCLPGSFLRLNYDGKMWSAREANFMSEQGTLDFYGTTFSVEKVKLEINAVSNIILVDGTFTKKSADGTLITLSVTTNPQKGDNIINQLEFDLTSDNPQDKTTTQILSRLRYNRSIEELSPEQRETLLQDEAMQLISTSVSTTYVSQFLSPIENRIRRFLGLDSFSITTGFIQNLFVEFTRNDQSGDFDNPGGLDADILQFSSSVFLNNLSLSMGKYIGSRFFIDYEIYIQEVTDLANKTDLDFYHNFTFRFILPWKLRLNYTFSVRPEGEDNSHEIMLHRSFRF